MDGSDLDAVGAAGFSLGGYTACALLGARIDATRYRALAERTVKPPPTAEYPDLDAAIESSTTVDERARWPALSARDYSDPRVAAAFVICPSLGSMLDDDSLARIDRPLEVRWAGSDRSRNPPPPTPSPSSASI